MLKTCNFVKCSRFYQSFGKKKSSKINNFRDLYLFYFVLSEEKRLEIHKGREIFDFLGYKF